MRVALLAMFLMASATSAVETQAPAAPGITITLDGGGYQRQQITIQPLVTSFCNTVWKSSRDPRINHLAVCFDGGSGGPEIQLNVPAVLGPYGFDKIDQKKAERNPYLGFEFMFDKYGASQRVYAADHIEVVITRLDPAGGRIEGTLKGTLSGPQSATVNVTGAFSAVRENDRLVD